MCKQVAELEDGTRIVPLAAVPVQHSHGFFNTRRLDECGSSGLIFAHTTTNVWYETKRQQACWVCIFFSGSMVVENVYLGVREERLWQVRLHTRPLVYFSHAFKSGSCRTECVISSNKES